MASQGHDTPAKPVAFLTTSIATVMATSREVTYVSFPLAFSSRFRWTTPPLGRVLLVSAELVMVVVLCFYKLNPNDQWQWEDLGYRTGFIALAQMPLVFLLASKSNIIGLLVGCSYERLSWLHRWTARILFLIVTIHMGFWFVDWARYDYITFKLTKDAITKRGFAAWCIMLWIVLSSFAPIRRWNYEFFIIQHILTFAGFTAAVYLHVPAEGKVWVWISIGIALFDRVVRALLVLYANLSVFYPSKYREGFWACKATFEPLGSNMTRIIIDDPPISWHVGQHVLLSCHSIAPFQSHPFTIASIPQDGRMEFLVKSKSGGTKRFLAHALKNRGLPSTTGIRTVSQISSVVIEGAYGRIRPLQQFDSVMLIAGSSGGTFTVPLMRDIVASWKGDKPSQGLFRLPGGVATRYIRFVWVVKSKDQFAWFGTQLSVVAQDVEHLRGNGYDFKIDMSIYVTCDKDLITNNKGTAESARPTPTHSKPRETLGSSNSSKNNTKTEDNISLHSAASYSENPQDLNLSCGPNGTCYCIETIEYESDVSNGTKSCQCRCGSESRKSPEPKLSAESSSSGEQPSSPLNPEKPVARSFHPTIAMLSGRPRPTNLIRKLLEQALGESAIVVCGPQGLVDDIRQCIVALSDERAVHKGSGAQGIYLHTESFDY